VLIIPEIKWQHKYLGCCLFHICRIHKNKMYKQVLCICFLDFISSLTNQTHLFKSSSPLTFLWWWGGETESFSFKGLILKVQIWNWFSSQLLYRIWFVFLSRATLSLVSSFSNFYRGLWSPGSVNPLRVAKLSSF
jgi:hypothetical protein